MAAEGGGAESQNKNLSTVANSLLMVSAGWGLQIAVDRPFLGAAFGLYTLKGLFGVLNKVVENSNIKKISEEVDSITSHFGIPLVATEMTKSDCVAILPTVSEYFVVPLCNYFGKFLDLKIDPKILAVSQGFSLGATAACVNKRNSDPGQVLFVHAFLGAVGSEGLVPEEYNTFVLAVACALAWATVSGKMPNLLP